MGLGVGFFYKGVNTNSLDGKYGCTNLNGISKKVCGENLCGIEG